jgi:hypothetical protein
VRLLHRRHEGEIVERLDQPDARMRPQRGDRHAFHVRIRMHRVEELDVGALVREMADGAADVLQRRAEVFPAVRSDQHQPQAGKRRAVVALRRDLEQGVDHGVAGDAYAGGRDALLHKIGARLLRRREMPACDAGGDQAVHFLGERAVQVAGPQSRFDMAEGHLVVEAAQRRRHGSRGVALRQQRIRTRAGERLVEILEQAAGEPGQGLVGPHDPEVGVGPDAENCEHLVQELAVLRGAQHRAFAPGLGLEPPDHRRHLYRLRPRADHASDAPGAARYPDRQNVHRCSFFNGRTPPAGRRDKTQAAGP